MSSHNPPDPTPPRDAATSSSYFQQPPQQQQQQQEELRSHNPSAADMGLPQLNLPMSEILLPHETDVLCGRGGAALRHPGNQTYRRLVAMNKGLYITCLKAEKLKISRSIVAAIREQNGRFLERDVHDGSWYDIGDKKAMEKTSQALREGQPKLRQKIVELGQKQLQSEQEGGNTADGDGEPVKLLTGGTADPVDLAERNHAVIMKSLYEQRQARAKEEKEKQERQSSGVDSFNESLGNITDYMQASHPAAGGGQQQQCPVVASGCVAGGHASFHDSFSSVATQLHSNIAPGDVISNHVYHQQQRHSYHHTPQIGGVSNFDRRVSADSVSPSELAILQAIQNSGQQIIIPQLLQPSDAMGKELNLSKLSLYGDDDQNEGNGDEEHIVRRPRLVVGEVSTSARSLMSDISSFRGEASGHEGSMRSLLTEGDGSQPPEEEGDAEGGGEASPFNYWDSSATPKPSLVISNRQQNEEEREIVPPQQIAIPDSAQSAESKPISRPEETSSSSDPEMEPGSNGKSKNFDRRNLFARMKRRPPSGAKNDDSTSKKQSGGKHEGTSDLSQPLSHGLPPSGAINAALLALSPLPPSHPRSCDYQPASIPPRPRTPTSHSGRSSPSPISDTGGNSGGGPENKESTTFESKRSLMSGISFIGGGGESKRSLMSGMSLVGGAGGESKRSIMSGMSEGISLFSDLSKNIGNVSTRSIALSDFSGIEETSDHDYAAAENDTSDLAALGCHQQQQHFGEDGDLKGGGWVGGSTSPSAISSKSNSMESF